MSVEEDVNKEVQAMVDTIQLQKSERRYLLGYMCFSTMQLIVLILFRILFPS